MSVSLYSHILCKIITIFTLTLVPFDTCSGWFHGGPDFLNSARISVTPSIGASGQGTSIVLVNCFRRDSVSFLNPNAVTLVSGDIELINDTQSNCQVTFGHPSLPDQVVCTGPTIDIEVGCADSPNHAMFFGVNRGTTVDLVVEPSTNVANHWFEDRFSSPRWSTTVPSSCSATSNSEVTCMLVTSGGAFQSYIEYS